MAKIPLYNTDIVPPRNRPELTGLADSDIFIVEDLADNKIKKLTKANAKDTLGIDNLAGAGRTSETVKGNADSIDLLGINKVPYSGATQDVNLGLKGLVAAYLKGEAPNIIIMEALGFAPRNLMDVYGTLTVAATFEAVRADIAVNKFKNLRLGDYIDFDSFTVNNWYNGAAYDSATGAWDTSVTVTKNLSYENTRVEIVGFDDYYYVGNTAYPSNHHVTFMFSEIPLTAPMHKLNVSPYYQTSQQYSGSDLVKKGLANWYTAIASQFGTAIPYSVDRYIATTDSFEWAGAEKLFLPTGMNIFGHPGFAHAQRGVGTQSQFPLYALNPNKRMKRRNGSIRQYWWLAEPSAGSSSYFATVSDLGILYNTNSYHSLGVAPAFLI